MAKKRAVGRYPQGVPNEVFKCKARRRTVAGGWEQGRSEKRLLCFAPYVEFTGFRCGRLLLGEQRATIAALVAFSLNVVDVLKIFRDRGIVERTQVCEFLEEIAAEASQLAEIWARIYDSVGNNRMVFRQRMVRERLREYYGSASRVLSGRLNENDLEILFGELGGILVTRDKAKEKIERIRVAAHSVQQMQEEIRSLIDELQKSAATLHVLAKTIRYEKNSR